MLLRILIGSDHKTTVSVSTDTYLAEILEYICAKRNLGRPDQYAFLVSGDQKERFFAPLDRTVESLVGKSELMLIKSDELEKYGLSQSVGRSSDPNGQRRSSGPFEVC